MKRYKTLFLTLFFSLMLVVSGCCKCRLIIDDKGKDPEQEQEDQDPEPENPLDKLPENALKFGPIGLYIYSNTATTAVIKGAVNTNELTGINEYGFVYSMDNTINEEDVLLKIAELSAESQFSETVNSLPYNTTIYYTAFLKQDGTYKFGEVRNFKTENIIINITGVEAGVTSLTFTGNAIRKPEDVEVKLGIMCSRHSNFSSDLHTGEISPADDGSFTLEVTGLAADQTNYYRSYTNQADVYKYGETKSCKTKEFSYDQQSDLDLSSAMDLSSNGTANSYIISGPGLYKFKAVKGNSDESVGVAAKASILWETLGTDTAPAKSDFITAFCYKDGYIAFQTNENYQKGNASIAVKDIDGKILWSWHLWYTEEPKEQIYYNNAGTLMDRNLGATSATPGDVGALGLMYQWGRKDPFLGSSSTTQDNKTAISTIYLPSSVSSNSTTGTIDYTIANPTTFIGENTQNHDWHYTGDASVELERWQIEKTIYDPCPVGWKVPEGNKSGSPTGIWSKATKVMNEYYFPADNSNPGVNLTGILGNDEIIWYPFTGYLDHNYGNVKYLSNNYGYYWAANNYWNQYAATLMVETYRIKMDNGYYRSLGMAIRCIKE